MARRASDDEYYALIRACMGSSAGDNVAAVADFSGTAGDRDAQAAVFASFKANINREFVSGDEIMEEMVETEYAALLAADRTWINSVAAMDQIRMDNGSEVRAGLLALFAGSQTLTNMQAEFQDPRSVWEWANDHYGPAPTPPTLPDVPGDSSDPLDARRISPRGADIEEAWL